jgi:hypothetical protein
MRKTLSSLLGAAVLAVVFGIVTPNEAAAHPYGYYRIHHYRPAPVYRYRPPRVRYYYAPPAHPAYRCYYGGPYYGPYFYGGPRVHIGFGF